MYAVIRAGGKQYRVTPGDVIRIEKVAPAAGSQDVEFETLAVSGSEGQIERPQGEARVVGRVLGQFRADKVMVFHFKRKKQYKKLAGHRQPFTAVRITEIAFDGQKFTAPELPVKAPKVKEPKGPKVEISAAAEEAPEKKKAAPHKKTVHAAAKHEAHHAPSHKPAGKGKDKGGKPHKKK